MRFNAFVFLSFLLLAAVAATTGCSQYRVYDLDKQIQIEPEFSTRGEREPYMAVVGPFVDQRDRDYSSYYWHAVPVVGLFAQWFAPSTHTYPEVTKNTNNNPAFIGDMFIQGDFSRAIPKVMAEQLQKAGIFSDVKYVDSFDENFDIRRYDYIIRGSLKSTKLKVFNWDYGLNFFNVLDLSFVLKLLALPDERYSGRVIYEIEIIERTSGNTVYTAQQEYGPVGHIRGYYYGRKAKALPVAMGIYLKVLEEQMGPTIDDIRTALP